MSEKASQSQQGLNQGGATIWPVIGVASLGLALVAAGVLFFYLPPGRYPYVMIGLPAIPFIYFAMWCFKRDGIVREGRIAQAKRAS